MAAARERAMNFGPRRLRLTPEGRGSINWERWEGLLFEKLQNLLANLPDEFEEDEETESTAEGEDVIAGETPDRSQLELSDATASSSYSSDRAAAAFAVEEALDAAYFARYDDPRVHEPALRDKALAAAFRNAVADGAVAGRTVLDVGCSFGHLSLMCAQAGARHVYAVEGSRATAATAAKIVAANGQADRVTVLEGRLEDVELPEPVDVIISNWFGPALLSGGMLRSVLLARCRWLRPGGLLLPGIARLYVTGVEDGSYLLERKQDWDKVQGFVMTPVMQQVIKQPRVAGLVRESQIMTDTVLLHELDLRTADPSAALAVASAPFQLRAKRDDRLFGLMLHFDALFPTTAGEAVSGETDSTSASTTSASGTDTSASGTAGTAGDAASPASSTSSSSSPSPSLTTASASAPVPAPVPAVVFSTDPSAASTHYEQVFLNFPRSIPMSQGDVVTGTVAMSPVGPSGRDLQLDVEVDYKGMVARISYTLRA